LAAAGTVIAVQSASLRHGPNCGGSPGIEGKLPFLRSVAVQENMIAPLSATEGEDCGNVFGECVGCGRYKPSQAHSRDGERLVMAGKLRPIIEHLGCRTADMRGAEHQIASKVASGRRWGIRYRTPCLARCRRRDDEEDSQGGNAGIGISAPLGACPRRRIRGATIGDVDAQSHRAKRLPSLA
jgi:hypothetical protein